MIRKDVVTGLFFGSFNPIHVGHMVMANYFVTEGGMGDVWFVVSPHNPLKEQRSLASESDRLEMVRLAIGDDLRFRASDIEFRMPKPSYTVDTLVRLKEKYPNREFALIMGGDNLAVFHKWKNPEAILEQFKVFVYARPGYDGGRYAGHPAIIILEPPQMSVSSSYIRQGIARGFDMRHTLPAGVWNYIDKNNLYRG